MGVRLLALAALGLALAGCQSGPPARADSVVVAGQPFELAGAQQVSLGDTSLRLRFIDVLEDSRCPTEVECFWTGQARIAVAIEQGSDAPTTVEFNTNPAPDQNRQTVVTGGYTLTLQRLDPYPRTPDDAPPLSDYRATLLVRDAD